MTRFAYLGVLASLAAVLAAQVFGVFGDPPMGLANNGDYGKIIGPYSLGSPEKFEYRYAPVYYQFAPEYLQRPAYLSSEKILAAIPVRLGRWLFPADKFDMRLVAVFQGVLYLLVVGIGARAVARMEGFKRLWIAIPASVAVVLILGDAYFASFFSSFYMDFPAILGLLLLASVAIHSAVRQSKPAIFSIACIALLLVGSKTPHGLCAIPILIWLAWDRALLTFSRPAMASWLKIAMVAATAWIIVTRGGPQDYRQIAIYSVIFYEILPAAADPKAELEKLAGLGLKSTDAAYIGTYLYSSEGGMQQPEFRERFLRKASYWRLAWYYLRTPQAAWRLIVKAMGEAGRQRALLGNFPPGSGHASSELSHRFSLWSDWKSTVFSARGELYLLYCAAVFAGAAMLARRFAKPLLPLVLMLAGIAGIECMLNALTDVLETTRHFTLFNAIVDVCFLLLFAMLLNRRGRIDPVVA